ncbi:hypothetical protein FRC03_004093 [Tulasnella sp. 419]|nr:hypothetical protein FRC03_004093 [Tulasnella sp. 419]
MNKLTMVLRLLPRISSIRRSPLHGHRGSKFRLLQACCVHTTVYAPTQSPNSASRDLGSMLAGQITLFGQEMDRMRLAREMDLGDKAITLVRGVCKALSSSLGIPHSGDQKALCRDLLFISYHLVKQGRQEDASMTLTQAVRLLLQESPKKGDPQALLERADTLVQASQLGIEVGLAEEALQLSESLVHTVRQLVELQPGSHSLSRLGAAELNHACRHIDLEQLEAALLPMSRALMASRQVTLHQDAVSRFNTLGVALREMSYLSAALGRTEEAFSYSEESLRLARAAYSAIGPSFAPILIDSLKDFSNCGLALRCGGDKICYVAHELRWIMEAGWAHRPEDYLIRGSIASKVAEYAQDLLKEGQHAEALNMVEDLSSLQDFSESLDHQELGNVHFTQGACLWDCGHHEQAIEAMRQSVTHYQNAGPEGELQLACVLNELGRAFHSIGRAEDALQATTNAAELQKKSIASKSDIQDNIHELLNLAVYMIELSYRHMTLMDFHSALEVATDAHAICQQNLEHPLAHAKMIDALLSRCKAYFGLADHPNVVKLVTEAIVILEFQIGEEREMEASIEKAMECCRLLIPSLEAIGGAAEEIVEAKSFLQHLSRLQKDKQKDAQSRLIQNGI